MACILNNVRKLYLSPVVKLISIIQMYFRTYSLYNKKQH